MNAPARAVGAVALLALLHASEAFHHGHLPATRLHFTPGAGACFACRRAACGGDDALGAKPSGAIGRAGPSRGLRDAAARGRGRCCALYLAPMLLQPSCRLCSSSGC